MVLAKMPNIEGIKFKDLEKCDLFKAFVSVINIRTSGQKQLVSVAEGWSCFVYLNDFPGKTTVHINPVSLSVTACYNLWCDNGQLPSTLQHGTCPVCRKDLNGETYKEDFSPSMNSDSSNSSDEFQSLHWHSQASSNSTKLVWSTRKPEWTGEANWMTWNSVTWTCVWSLSVWTCLKLLAFPHHHKLYALPSTESILFPSGCVDL